MLGSSGEVMANASSRESCDSCFDISGKSEDDELTSVCCEDTVLPDLLPRLEIPLEVERRRRELEEVGTCRSGEATASLS